MDTKGSQSNQKIQNNCSDSTYKNYPDCKLINYKNSGNNMRLMLEIKNLFQVQLPRMPRQYILRTLVDENHLNLVMMNDQNILIGGLCFRLFRQSQLAELVFFAIKEQYKRKRFGKKLMDVMKSFLQNIQINYILTYADNLAYEFFLKQGFSKSITLPKQKHLGLIKGYDGGTKMQYSISPKIDYLNSDNLIKSHKQYVLSQIKRICLEKVQLEKSLKLSKIELDSLIQKDSPNPFIVAVKKLPGMHQYHQQETQTNTQDEVVNLFEECKDLIYEIFNHPKGKIFERLSKEQTQTKQKGNSKPTQFKDLLEKLSKKTYKKLGSFVQDLNYLIDRIKKNYLYNERKNQFTELEEMIEKKIKNLFEIEESLACQKKAIEQKGNKTNLNNP